MSARLIRQFVFVLLSAVLAVSTALAADPKRNLAVASKAVPANEARVALVIGNSTYKDAPLRNPVNDAQDVAKELSRLGFKVTLKENADQKTMKQAIRDFGGQLKAGGVGLFYYAGHGMQVKGRNYLVPVGVDIQSEDEVEDQSVDVSLVLEKMESAKNRVNVVVLDACRNNPFARRFRSAASGLGAMDAAKGSYIAYATAPNSVAADGAGRNGIYTKHLLASLKHSESDIEKVFKRVRAGVAGETGGKQVPWESSSLIGDFYFNPSAKPGQAAAPVAADPLVVELAYWESIKDSQSAEDYQEYLKKYPTGRFAPLARHMLKELAAAPATVRVQTPEEVEQELWNTIKDSRDSRDVEQYLEQYPQGRFAPLAQQKLKALASATPALQKPVSSYPDPYQVDPYQAYGGGYKSGGRYYLTAAECWNNAFQYFVVVLPNTVEGNHEAQRLATIKCPP